MKIGFVLDDSLDKPDGVQQYILTLGHWLSAQGHDVHYLVGQTHREDVANIHSLSRNLNVRFNKNRMSTPLPANRSRIKRLLAEERFDILHVQLPYSPLLAGRLISSAPEDTAVVGTFHIVPATAIESIATRLLGILTRRTLERFDKVFSVSAPAAETAKAAFHLTSDVVPNVVASEVFNHDNKASRSDILKIIFLGRLVERKGCMYLLKALSALAERDELRGVEVYICGKGPHEAKLKDFASQHGLEHVVRFVGYVSEQEKFRYLNMADIAVFPSTGGESFGIVLIEAMAAGSDVVIGGDNVGYRSVLIDRPEQLVDPTDTGSFARTLSKFMKDKSERDAARDWQQEYVRRFDVSRVGAELVAHYEQAIAKRNQSVHNKVKGTST